MKHRQRGYVSLQRPAIPSSAKPSRPRSKLRWGRLFAAPALARGRAFCTGLLLGAGFWAALFAVLN